MTSYNSKSKTKSKVKTNKLKTNKSKKSKNKANSTSKNKKIIIPFEAAQKAYAKTGSIQTARKKFRQQSLTNARRLFGSLTNYYLM